MTKSKVSLSLKQISRPDDQKRRYKVVSQVNTTKFSVGGYLDEKEVKDAIREKVNVTIK